MIWVCLELNDPVNTIKAMSNRSIFLTFSWTGLVLLSGEPLLVHILSPETDNCPSLISGRERITVENIS